MWVELGSESDCQHMSLEITQLSEDIETTGSAEATKEEGREIGRLSSGESPAWTFP